MKQIPSCLLKQSNKWRKYRHKPGSHLADFQTIIKKAFAMQREGIPGAIHLWKEGSDHNHNIYIVEWSATEVLTNNEIQELKQWINGVNNSPLRPKNSIDKIEIALEAHVRNSKWFNVHRTIDYAIVDARKY